MKRSRQHQVVVRREFLQASLEVPLVDEASGLVDNDQRVDGPGSESQ